MMNFQPYKAYQETSCSYLWCLPQDWGCIPAKHIGRFSASGIDKKNVEGEVPVKMFNYTDVYKSRTKILESSQHLMVTTAPAQKALDHAVKHGDLLLTPSSETADDIGHAALVTSTQTNVVYSYHLQRFRPKNTVEPCFLKWAFNCQPVRAHFSSVCTGTTRMVLSRDDFNQCLLPAPSLNEQRTIAAFLDHETAKIDRLIAKQQRLIVLLKEKQQAVISHVATKGLNKDAPMKDSGVEWLGEVPAHWRTLRIASITTKITNGFVGPTRNILVDEGVPYLQSLHIKNGMIFFERGEYFVTEEWSNVHQKSILRKGDTLLVQTGAEVGQCAVVTQQHEGCNCHALIIMSPKLDYYNGEFLDLVLRSEYGRRSLESIQTGALHPHLNCTLVRDLYVPTPPLEEQAEIKKALDNFDTKSSMLLVKTEHAISLLKEHRIALISAAVTGKIDVRSWQKPDTEPEETATAVSA